MKIGVLALQGDFGEHITIFSQLGADTVEVRLPHDLDGLDSLIVPGGESTTIARLLHRWELRAPIRERVRDGMAVWGTCAGAILLANEAGDLDREGLRLMDIAVERNSFGRQVDSFEADLEIDAIGGDPYHCIFIRAPRIKDTGPAVDVLAELDDGTIVAARENNMLASVFHPELTDDHRFHQLFLEMASGDVVPIDIKRTAQRASR